MPGLVHKTSRKAGKPPGTLVFIGRRMQETVKMHVTDYTPSRIIDRDAKKVGECFPYMKKPTTTWINVTGVHDTEIIEKLGKCFGLHSLTMEDILNTGQRPKVDDFDKYLFIVLKMIRMEGKEIEIEQVSIVLGRGFVISFQEREGDVFNQIRERIKKKGSRFRKLGNDYLAYALMDAVVDNYFSVLENIGERIESMEEELVGNPNPKTLNEIHKLKRELIFLRKSVWPLREVISTIQRGDSKLFEKKTQMYLRDVYDHTIQVIDTIETFRDMVSGMLDIYLSSVSNRMNEVMKVLTIFASIFIPLTFVAGIYGMNFRYMPELDWEWGYPIVWLVIIMMSSTMLIYFRRKGWL
jgi:magnesium transporter